MQNKMSLSESFVHGSTMNRDPQPLLVYRPWTVRLTKADRTQVLPSSNGRLVWRTDIVAKGDPIRVPVPPRSSWREYVDGVDFYLHRFRASANVRRFAPSARANIRTLQDEFFGRCRFFER